MPGNIALTVGDLVETPSLGTIVLAGRSGLGRRVGWAHACELAQPWEWLSPDDLLLTIGYGVPRAPEQQVHYVRALHEARIAGVAIGNHEEAPVLSKAMLRAADQVGLPLLRTAYEISFSSIIRAVASANQADEYGRLVKTMRIYDLVRFGLARRDSFAQVVSAMESELGCRLHVVDRNGYAALVEAALPLEARKALRTQLARRAGRPTAVVRFTQSGVEFLGVPLPVEQGAFLIVSGVADQLPTIAMLHHVGTALALEIERRTVARERQRVTGQSLWDRLLGGRVDSQVADAELAEHDLDSGAGLRVVAFRETPELSSDELSRQLDDGGIPHLCVERPPDAFLLLPDDDRVLDLVKDILAACAPAGCSDSHTGAAAVREAAREARWGLVSAGDQAQFVRYGEQTDMFLPSTVDEARSVVDRVLGDLRRYDAEHGTQLMISLRVFLEQNRSWQRTSSLLTVHKQTLVYRMRRVEELTGHHLDDTGDVAVLWLALRALDIVNQR